MTAMDTPIAPAAGLLQAARLALAIAFILAIPFFLVGSTLRWVATDSAFIAQGFRENGVARTTRLDERQLNDIAQAFANYFQAPPGRLDIQVTVDSRPRPLLNEREIVHMEDVQALVRRFLDLQLLAAAVIAVRLVVAAFVDRSPAPVGREALWGAGVMVSVVVLVGVLAAIDFPGLWLRFHYIAFRNDLWLLDPTRDYLIMLFPEPFWYAATIRLAGATAAATLLVAVAGFFAARLGTAPPG